MAQQTTHNACFRWHFTLAKYHLNTSLNNDLVVEHFENFENDDYIDKWAFQEEEGEGGFRHYQGKVKLTRKKRLTTLKRELFRGMEWVHLEVEHNTRHNDWSYVTKPETRVAGPWGNVDSIPFVPIDVQGIELRPWQQQVVAMPQSWRTIDMIVDPVGNIGKTILWRWMMSRNQGQYLPPVNDFRDLMQIVMSVTADTYIVDMPRAMDKKHLKGFWSAIETIKAGYAFDMRYKFKQRMFNPPRIWVFANAPPDLTMLSQDRWRLWHVEDGYLTLQLGNQAEPPNDPPTQQLVDLDTYPSSDEEELG